MMAMGTLSDNEDDFNPEINTTPLVDVMLVLLIIFIITIPVINHSVNINLPRATNQPFDPKPAHISLTIDTAGSIMWDGQPISREELGSRVADAAARQPQPELHLNVDRAAQFEIVAQVMATAQSGGLSKIGFVTDAQAK